MKLLTTSWLLVLGVLCGPLSRSIAETAPQAVTFPESRPPGGSFSRPEDQEVLDVSPPGFSWWRAAPDGKLSYRLRVLSESGIEVYRSLPLSDPVHVPPTALPAGKYTWTVESLGPSGNVLGVRRPRRFEIADGAVAQPWIAPRELLSRVPREHPRLLFPKARLEEIRPSLQTSRREAFTSLRRQAARSLSMKPPPEPDYDRIEDPAERRLAYMASFQEMRRYHQGAMQHLALMYVLTGEKEYGQAAKAVLLGAAQWDPEGISSVMAPYGDEVGLGLVKSEALTYDWIYDLLDAHQRDKAEAMLVARADQMLRRLQRRDFLARPESSHDGRLPGYLVEHAIALAEHPRAEVWLDYALKSILTVFPHWAGRDGGWAEGLAYGTAYNSLFITPLESLRTATGLDVWQRSFYRKLPYFFFYNVSPTGEIMGFGDSYDGSATSRSGSLRSLIQFHAERTADPALRWWVDLLRLPDGGRPSLSALPGLILPQAVEPIPPEGLCPDAVFRGVGWAVLHSDLAHPDDDLTVALKSSPFGGVSHSYADQNCFAVLMGGRALARPGGTRYPQHGTPFHTRYTQQTVAQNGILVDGQGQINRSAAANGRIVAFESKPHIGYVCGDAAAAYGERLSRFRRHVVLIRPSLVCIVDELEAPRPARFQWLLHASEQFHLDEDAQMLVSRRGDARMAVRLISPSGFEFSQTNQWPLDPKTGFPTAKKREPTKLWHFTAATRERSATRRIAAVMSIAVGDRKPHCDVDADNSGKVRVHAKTKEAETVVGIDLSTDRADDAALLEVRYRPKAGDPEVLEVRRTLRWALLPALVVTLAPLGRAEEEVFRLGMIGLDTSHVIAFTSYRNNPNNETGCRVVAGYPGGSPDMPASADRVEKFTQQLRDQYGLEIVDSIEELCGKVDGILLESVDGRPHLEQARPVIAAGKPLFIDKPMAANLADVIEIFHLAAEHDVPCWSSSSARCGEGIVGARNNETLGEVVGCDVFGSSGWAEHHPDLYLYGIHAVEPLFAVMGTGCQSVRRIKTDGTDMVVGVWKGGRIGTFRDLRGGKSDHTAIIYGTKASATGKSSGYAPLLKEIIQFFKTGKPPVPAGETIEIFAFMSAADESKAAEGKAISIPELIEKARGSASTAR